MSLLSRSTVVSLCDIVLVAAAWYLSFLLRFNFSIPAEFVHSLLVTLPWVIAAQALVFRLFGLYKGIWRFASLPDLQQLVRAVAAAAVCAPLIILLLQPLVVPRSVYVLDPILLVMLMGGVRFAYRAWRENREFGALMARGKPVLVLGAGETAARLLREIGRSGQWRVVGLLDDNAKKHDRTLYGLRVLGPVSDLDRLARELKVSHAIIAMPNASHEARRDAANACVRAGVKPMTVPSFDDLISGRVAVAAVREVEVEDLLGRDPVKIDAPRLRQLIEGQRRHGHRRRRVDRIGTVPPDRALFAVGHRRLRARRVLPLHPGRGIRRGVSRRCASNR
jgi:FlaA1/EpsC-like NDP-sugar epimerase